jgi:hypothetical protein
VFIIAYRQQKNIENLIQALQLVRLGARFRKAWVGYCIALNKDEGEKTLLYASIIQKMQRELGIPVREFADVDMFGSVIDKEESNLAVIDPFTNEKIQDAKEDEDNYVEVDFNSL